MLPKIGQILLSIKNFFSLGGHPSKISHESYRLTCLINIFYMHSLVRIIKKKKFNFFFFFFFYQNILEEIIKRYFVCIDFNCVVILGSVRFGSVRFGSVRFGLTLNRCDPRNGKSTLAFHSSKQWIWT